MNSRQSQLASSQQPKMSLSTLHQNQLFPVCSHNVTTACVILAVQPPCLARPTAGTSPKSRISVIPPRSRPLPMACWGAVSLLDNLLVWWTAHSPWLHGLTIVFAQGLLFSVFIGDVSMPDTNKPNILDSSQVPIIGPVKTSIMYAGQ
ncbi:hypothetical protein IF1G_07151 [Cordyceps javanica]|uniref:Uncharacterized protein n=1 Tax=Cordyceps javanica TaxID=43265 RepID=A0A545UXT1_9HYPO|nr:hypothetical protein IF1G_07151 [Cordyceps javanica]